MRDITVDNNNSNGQPKTRGAKKYQQMGVRLESTKVKIAAARELAGEILNNDEYRAGLRARAITGTLAPAIEAMLWYYYFGKPVDKVEIEAKTSSVEDYESLDSETLAKRASQLSEALLMLNTGDNSNKPN
jgi:hypothetical protein